MAHPGPCMLQEKVLSEVKCSSCRELLDHAIYNIETGGRVLGHGRCRLGHGRGRDGMARQPMPPRSACQGHRNRGRRRVLDI